MAHKLERFRERIEELRPSSSVREMARILSEETAEKIAPSTVQHYISTVLKPGEREQEPQPEIKITQADLDEVMGHLAEAVDAVKAEREHNAPDDERSGKKPKPQWRRSRQQAWQPPNRSRGSSLKSAVIGVGAVFALWLSIQGWNWYQMRPPSPEKTSGKGVYVELFKTDQGWVGVRWPVALQSPLTRTVYGYRLTANGVTREFDAYQRTSRVDAKAPVGVLYEGTSDLKKFTAFCFDNRDTLDCGSLLIFVDQERNWHKVDVMEGKFWER